MPPTAPNRLNPNSESAELGPALQSLVARAERALQRCLPPAAHATDHLRRAMHYAVMGGGKRLRPMLVYATAHALDEDGPALDAAACAVELIHEIGRASCRERVEVQGGGGR